MLRQAVQGARWYQHVARKSPSVFSRPRPHAFSIIASRCIHYGGPNDKVNFYEQDTRGSKKRRKIDPEAEDREEQKEVEDELSRLDQELEILKEGPYGPNSDFMKSLPEKDRVVALEALRKHAEKKVGQDKGVGLDEVFDEELDQMIRKEFEGLAVEEEDWKLDDTDDAPKPVIRRPYEVVLNDSESHAYVEKFNQCLKKLTRDDSNQQLRQELWRWYRRCKQVTPAFLESMPDETITLVWDSQTGEAEGSSQTTHLQILAEDVMSIGRSLSTPHVLAYIESLQDSGKTDRALDKWEASQTELSQRKEDLEAYWKLGVRLFAAADDPQRAQDIALAFLANDKSRQPRVLIPVITAWARQSGKGAEAKSWAIYLRLKTFLGPDMTMEDYDNVSIGLLKAGRLDLAIAVFKDMMVTGQDPANDSTALYKAALGVAGHLHASSISEQEVNKVSLSALTVLPRRFQNRFFYASWMKKLIGMGEVDSAALVIELMYERGVKPDPKHLNGIVAAWLREGNSAARDKAERLAWAMIQQRIDMVWARTSPSGKPPQLSIGQGSDNETIRLPRFMQRTVPPANIETFSILLLHYTRRSDDDMVKYLIKCLGDARIQPNSYLMNHLLYAELRKQDIRSLWHKYTAMAATVKPDLETYACLWDCGKLQFDRGRTAFDAGFPSARGLYHEMTRWYSQLSPRGKATTQDDFSKELYDQIIRCFCLSKDLPGALVALHAMGTAFSIFPDETTARLIILSVARHAGVSADTPKRRLRRLSSTPKSKENIAQVHRLVEILSDRKAATLQAQGLNPDQLDPHEKQLHQLEIMVELLRVVMSRTATDPNRVEGQIAAAAVEMGVEGLDLGSPLGGDSLLLQ